MDRVRVAESDRGRVDRAPDLFPDISIGDAPVTDGGA